MSVYEYEKLFEFSWDDNNMLTIDFTHKGALDNLIPISLLLP